MKVKKIHIENYRMLKRMVYAALYIFLIEI